MPSKMPSSRSPVCPPGVKPIYIFNIYIYIYRSGLPVKVDDHDGGNIKHHLIDLHLCVHTLSLVIDFLYCRRQTRRDINLGRNLSYPVIKQNRFVPYTMSNYLAMASVLSVALPKHASYHGGF